MEGPAAVLEAGTTEEELKQILIGKPLYLRSGYLDNTLSFNEHGALIGHASQGSYTLSAIDIEKVHLTKHKLELEGARYGLHFLGALPSEDPTKALDRVRITPKKKVVKITIDRELVVLPKKKKEKEAAKEKRSNPGAVHATAQPVPAAPGPTAAAVQPSAAEPAKLPEAPAVQPANGSAPSSDEKELSSAEEVKAAVAAAPAAERPADPASMTTTISPAHAARVLKEALDNVFAVGLDDRMMAAMPEFWKLYYRAVAAKADYQPTDPTVMRQNNVDQKARLLTTFEPESNEYAQANAVAGMALYHTVIGPDGRPGEIAVARPIGFGLDENAVEAIRKAKFSPAIKDGKPVPVLLNLVVQFRIFSKRTAVTNPPEPADKQSAKAPETQLPGPYSVQH
jgi:TonB family protein